MKNMQNTAIEINISRIFAHIKLNNFVFRKLLSTLKRSLIDIELMIIRIIGRITNRKKLADLSRMIRSCILNRKMDLGRNHVFIYWTAIV